MGTSIFDLARQVDIVSVISHYTTPVRHGANYLALCPFHKDTSLGSFVISPGNGDKKGLFTCFSCGESGDVIDFVSKVEGISLMDAAVQICVDDNLLTAEEVEKFKTDDAPIVPRPKKVIRKADKLVPKRDDEHLHLVYLAFVRASGGLTSEFKRMLLEDRHLNEEDLSNFFVYPSPDDRDFLVRFHRELSNLLHTDDPEKLAKALLGVPGFFLNREHKVTFMSAKGPSLGILLCNRKMQIAGIQLRAMGNAPGPRYLFMSSSFANGRDGLSYGCSCGQVEDVLFPRSWCKGIAITEGYFKALTLAKMGFLVVDMHGISNWAFASTVARELAEEYSARLYVLVYDVEDNDCVKKSASKVYERLSADRPVRFAVWDKKYGKGIDDVVNAGFRDKIERVTAKEYFGTAVCETGNFPVAS